MTPTMPQEASPVVHIEDARTGHVPAIANIFAWYVFDALCTSEETAPSVAEIHRRFDAIRREGLPWQVALRGDTVDAYAGRYRARSAYLGTVENSIYLAREHQGQGIGRKLLQALIDACKAAHRRQMVAVIGDSANEASIALHERSGFRMVGVLTEVGAKFDRPVDTVLMQRGLRP